MRQFRLRIACLFLTVVPTTPLSWAQTFPAKPIRVVVPYAPGGVIDATARLVAEKLTQSLGQAVVVDNKTGAAGMIGADTVAKAAPDGYTLLIASPGEVAINQSLYQKMAYSPEADSRRSRYLQTHRWCWSSIQRSQPCPSRTLSTSPRNRQDSFPSHLRARAAYRISLGSRSSILPTSMLFRCRTKAVGPRRSISSEAAFPSRFSALHRSWDT